MQIPQTQSQLIRIARASQTQAEFAKTLGVDRTCLSRYERELLGAPVTVINFCLAEVANRIRNLQRRPTAIADILAQARLLVTSLEQIDGHPDISTVRSTNGEQQ